MKLTILLNPLPRIYMVSKSSPEFEALEYTGQNGLYSAVQPNKRSKEFIMSLAQQLGFDIDSDKLHCTVMYSKENCPAKDVSCESDRMYRCRVKKIQHWGGHDDKGYVTAALESPELEAEHYRLKGLGCVPTFSPYEPHITLWAGVKMTTDLKQKMEEVTRNLAGAPDLMFGWQHIGDLKDD